MQREQLWATGYFETMLWTVMLYAVLLALILGPISGGLLLGLGGIVVAAVAVPREAGGGAHWWADVGFAALFAVALYVSTAFAQRPMSSPDGPLPPRTATSSSREPRFHALDVHSSSAPIVPPWSAGSAAFPMFCS